MVRRVSVAQVRQFGREGRSVLPLLALAALWACGSDDVAEVRAGQLALARSSHLTWTAATNSALGFFTETTELDCDRVYLHHVATIDLTPLGIEHGRTLVEGAPRAHQESEQLVVNGQTYERRTTAWADRAHDTTRAWAHAPNGHSVVGDCGALHRGEDNPLVPLSKILAARRLAFVATRTVGGVACRDYAVSYEGTADVEAPRMTAIGWAPPGATEATNLVQAQLCLATSDHRPVRSRSGRRTVTFSYTPVTPTDPPPVH